MYDVWNGRVEVERWRDVGEWKGSERREMKNADIENLVAKIRQIAYDLHVYLGAGLLEKVYENGLVHRLRKAGFRVEKCSDQLLEDSGAHGTTWFVIARKEAKKAV